MVFFLRMTTMLIVIISMCYRTFGASYGRLHTNRVCGSSMRISMSMSMMLMVFMLLVLSVLFVLLLVCNTNSR